MEKDTVHTVETITQIIKKELPEIEDQDTLTFLASEIYTNFEFCVKNPENTIQILSEHLKNYRILENEVQCANACENIQEELIKPPFLEPEEEEGEINSDVDLDDGQCELCEREMPLTFHHLIPRTTHKKLLKRGFERKELNIGIMVCRPCHNAIHRLIDEETMASDYNTFEKLLQHEGVQKWIPYAMKQKVVTHAMKKYKK